MYNGLNAMRITSVTSTPLRLRATLNAFAQAQADLICNSNAPVYSSTQLIADLQSSAGITTENAEMLSIGNMLTADSVVAAWAAEKPGKTSPFSAIIYPVYVYAGFGVCNGNWVVVLTSEFE
ncbi:hypothetical protein GGI02_001154 [Coemansia sp. RSA 2322]|nr:hypothetical protein GGI02_001154 [Coemansia sp. RSA 2322]